MSDCDRRGFLGGIFGYAAALLGRKPKPGWPVDAVNDVARIKATAGSLFPPGYPTYTYEDLIRDYNRPWTPDLESRFVSYWVYGPQFSHKLTDPGETFVIDTANLES